MKKWEKVLVTLYRLSGESSSAISYEDIVVEAYKTYPDDFALRGYPSYPDASDIHKPLYNSLKARGLVRVSNKTFRLTDAGEHVAEKLLGSSSEPALGVRLTRKQAQAVARYTRSAAAELVTTGQEDQLIDVDCQRFYGFAAWTKPRDARALREEFLAVLTVLRSVNAAEANLLERTDTTIYSRFTHLFEGITDGHST